MTRTLAFLSICIPLFSGTYLWEQGRAQSQLIRRYESGYSSASLEESATYLADAAGSKGMIAIRVCSKEPILIALATAAADPFVLLTSLETTYGIPPKRVTYLRADNCVGSTPNVAATEFWAIPDGAELPAHVESITSSQVQLEHIGAGASAVAGAPDYLTAARELVDKLRVSQGAQGVVLGYYYRKPNVTMRSRLSEVRRLLDRSGLPKDRYFVRLMPWPGDRSIDPPEPEPAYPNISIVKRITNGAPK